MSTPIKIDQIKLGLERLIDFWSDKPVAVGLLTSYLENIQVVEDMLFQLLEERSIDTAIGVQLDNLGVLIGQPREVEDGAYALYFGFEGNPNATGFNDAPFFTNGDPLLVTRTLTDEEYRIFLKARAVSNSSSGTPEEVINFFQVILGGNPNVIVEQSGIANAIISIGHAFTDEDKLIIISDPKNNWIPRPAGVSYTFKEFTPVGYFGFEGNPNAAGFNQGSFLSVIGTV